MSQIPFIVGGNGLYIGTNATSGNTLFDNTTGNFYIGNVSTGQGNLIINGNTTANGYAMTVTGGMSIQGNLYINGQTGLHATMSNVATIHVGDVFYCSGGIGPGGLPVGTIINVPASNIFVAIGTTYAQVPSGNYKVVGCFQSVQNRGLVTRIS